VRVEIQSPAESKKTRHEAEDLFTYVAKFLNGDQRQREEGKSYHSIRQNSLAKARHLKKQASGGQHKRTLVPTLDLAKGGKKANKGATT